MEEFVQIVPRKFPKNIPFALLTGWSGDKSFFSIFHRPAPTTVDNLCSLKWMNESGFCVPCIKILKIISK